MDGVLGWKTGAVANSRDDRHAGESRSPAVGERSCARSSGMRARYDEARHAPSEAPRAPRPPWRSGAASRARAHSARSRCWAATSSGRAAPSSTGRAPRPAAVRAAAGTWASVAWRARSTNGSSMASSGRWVSGLWTALHLMRVSLFLTSTRAWALGARLAAHFAATHTQRRLGLSNWHVRRRGQEGPRGTYASAASKPHT